MRRVAKNLRTAQLEDARAKFVLAEKVLQVEERMERRLHSAQKQYASNDDLRSASGISHAAGVGRLSLPGLKRRGLDEYKRKVDAYGEQLAREEQ